MAGEYALPRETQTLVLQWAPLADHIARRVDIPRETPLVIWFKENSMRAVNPDSCTGIMGAYDLVRYGEHPCFRPGPISDVEVTEQLTIGAVEFKKRCPEVTYWTQDPDLLQRCYLAYNAGITAAQRLDPHTSAYVMNNYSDSYRNMIYSDVELGTVTVTSLGAWPAHLAMQSLVVSQLDEDTDSISLTFLELSTRLFDWGATRIQHRFGSLQTEQGRLEFPATRSLADQACLGEPHLIGRPSLRASRNPVAENPILTQDIHGCEYGLPGLDISSSNGKAILLAPISGEATTYTDRWYNSTIRIENDEWIVWLLHPRSYLVREGKVHRGDPIGVMGAVGYATGPHVHYSLFDKVKETFVDPAKLMQ